MVLRYFLPMMFTTEADRCSDKARARILGDNIVSDAEPRCPKQAGYSTSIAITSR